MTQKKPQKILGRREFLMAAGGSAVGGASVVAGGRKAKAASPTTGKPVGGYQESSHVKKYYELTKF